MIFELKLEPQVSSLVIRNKIESILIHFRKNIEIAKTLKVINEKTEDRLFVRLDEENYPIIIQLILANGIDAQEEQICTNQLIMSMSQHLYEKLVELCDRTRTLLVYSKEIEQLEYQELIDYITSGILSFPIHREFSGSDDVAWNLPYAGY